MLILPTQDFYRRLFQDDIRPQLLVEAGTLAIVDATRGAQTYLDASLGDLQQMTLGDFFTTAEGNPLDGRTPEGMLRVRVRTAQGEARQAEARLSRAMDEGRPLLHVFLSDLGTGEGGAAADPGLKITDPVPEGVPAAFFQLLRDGKGTYSVPFLSQNYWSAFRLEPHQFAHTVQDAFVRHVHPEDLVGFLTAMEASHHGLTLFRHRARVFMRDKRVRWLESVAIPGRTIDGGTLWQGVLVDVTGDVEAAGQLRRDEETYRRMVEDAPAGVLVLDGEGTVVHANTAAAEALGQSGPQRLEGRPLAKWVAPGEGAAFSEALANPGSEPVRAGLKGGGTALLRFMEDPGGWLAVVVSPGP